MVTIVLAKDRLLAHSNKPSRQATPESEISSTPMLVLCRTTVFQAAIRVGA